jgi:hypothetical protein
VPAAVVDIVAAWSVDRLVLMIDLRRRPLIETRGA